MASVETISTPGANVQFMWPVPGVSTITSKFGNRTIFGGQQFHDAIDIGAPAGTKIVAAAAGVVTRSHFNTNGYGEYIIIKHDDGYETTYGHMLRGSRTVQVNQQVVQGQVIGQVGTTGSSTGNHLDFRVRKNGKSLDPTKFVTYRG